MGGHITSPHNCMIRTLRSRHVVRNGTHTAEAKKGKKTFGAARNLETNPLKGKESPMEKNRKRGVGVVQWHKLIGN